MLKINQFLIPTLFELKKKEDLDFLETNQKNKTLK